MVSTQILMAPEYMHHLSGFVRASTMVTWPLSGHWASSCLTWWRVTSPSRVTSRSAPLSSGSDTACPWSVRTWSDNVSLWTLLTDHHWPHCSHIPGSTLSTWTLSHLATWAQVCPYHLTTSTPSTTTTLAWTVLAATTAQETVAPPVWPVECHHPPQYLHMSPAGLIFFQWRQCSITVTWLNTNSVISTIYSELKWSPWWPMMLHMRLCPWWTRLKQQLKPMQRSNTCYKTI